MLPDVLAALAELPWGNPSSPHHEGQVARAALDAARDRAAAALDVEPRSIVFCSSGTEAVNLAIQGVGRRVRGRLVAWASAHQAVLAACRSLEIAGQPASVLPVGPDAGARAEDIPADAALVTLELANNEVGTVQPVAEIAAHTRSLGALVHLDACQGPQWLEPPLTFCELASFSGHKIGAGRGGLLVAKPGVRLEPLLYGGPQEWGRRAGREDLASAVAVSVALEVCARRRRAESERVRPLAARLQRELEACGGRPTGAEPRLPNFASVAFGDRRGEDMLLALDRLGIAASSGSACASGSLDPSHVLLAMGLSLEEALGSLRLTLSYASTESEVTAAGAALQQVLGSRSALLSRA